MNAWAWDSIPCARCEAKVGERCVTITGRPAEPHSARWAPLAQAYAEGYADGEKAAR